MQTTEESGAGQTRFLRSLHDKAESLYLQYDVGKDYVAA